MNAPEPIAAVVLAAGTSSRMGAHKLLLRLEGESLIRRVVRTLREVPVRDVVVVVGYDRAAVEAELTGLDVRFARNENYALGMGSSFAAGVRALDDGVEAALFVLADRPFVTVDLYRRLLESYRRTRAPLVAGSYDGIVAPPHVVRRDLFAQVGNDGVGIRPLLEQLGTAAVVLDFPREALFDIDEPADFERAQGLVRRTEPGGT